MPKTQDSMIVRCNKALHIRRMIQFTGLPIRQFALKYHIYKRTLENWISSENPTGGIREFELYALTRQMQMDYGWDDRYLLLSEQEWRTLLVERHGSDYLKRQDFYAERSEELRKLYIRRAESQQDSKDVPVDAETE